MCGVLRIRARHRRNATPGRLPILFFPRPQQHINYPRTRMYDRVYYLALGSQFPIYSNAIYPLTIGQPMITCKNFSNVAHTDIFIAIVL